MSIPITYTYGDLHKCGPVKKVFVNKNDKAYFKIKKVKKNPSIIIDNHITMIFTKLNYYTIDFTAYPKGCPFASLPIYLEQVYVTPDTSLTVIPGNNSISISGVIPVGTKLRIYTDPKLLMYLECSLLCGKLGISNVAATTDEITAADAATKIRYVPSTPQFLSLIPLTPYPPPSGPGSNPLLPGQYPELNSVFPWREAIIPWEQNQVFPSGGSVIITPDAPFGQTPFPPFPVPPFPTGTLNGYPDQYDKLQSVPNSVIYYIGFDQRKILPKTEAWTLFLTNFEDRGYSGPITDPEWLLANYQKKVYMNALSLDKLQFYLPKIEQFANNAFSAVTTYGRPIVSSFQENLILFFLRIHIGNQDYPDYVIKWFDGFVKFIGIGDASNPERSQLLMYGNTTSPLIFDYFEEKNNEVISNADKSTIAYWWSQAGLSSEALVFECVHNIVAFSQFNNVIYSTIYTGIYPANIISPINPYPNFLTEYAAAPTSNDKLNVIRECYRLLVPNSLSFSLVKPVVPDPDNNVIKSRHLHQAIMVSNQPVAPPQQLDSYFSYNPLQYNADFNTNLDNLIGMTVVTDVLAASVTSELDQETVIDNTEAPPRPIVPIFPKPIYAPFGLGYRRCAGEMITYLITEKLFDKFSTAQYREAANPDSYPLVSIAPFKRVRDSLFVQQL
jgi:hypothetical protein